MEKVDLTTYDIKPVGLINYLKYNGPHFNEKLLNFAVSKMYKQRNDEINKIEPYTEEDVHKLLNKYNIKLKSEDILLDPVYAANLAKADLTGSSIEDDRHLALYIKDVIDDVDGYDGMLFTHWYIDICIKGIPINWDKML